MSERKMWPALRSGGRTTWPVRDLQKLQGGVHTYSARVGRCFHIQGQNGVAIKASHDAILRRHRLCRLAMELAKQRREPSTDCRRISVVLKSKPNLPPPFGRVYRAYDPVLGRDVAVKVPHRGALQSVGDRGRFLREAKAAGQLRHPNIVPVYEAGADGDICCIASAFIEGHTLAEAIETKRPDLPACRKNRNGPGRRAGLCP